MHFSRAWVAVMLWIYFWCEGARASTLIRSVPSTFLPGGVLEVTLVCVPDAGVQVHAWEDLPPFGWKVDTISDGGFLDPTSGKVKWGFFLDDVPRTVKYQLRVPLIPERHVQWSGRGVFDALEMSTQGPDSSDLSASTVERSGPAFYVPGSSIDLVLRVTPDPLVRVYAIEDSLPEGWTASSLNLGGILDPVTRRLKWGPFFDGQPRVLTCRLAVPASETRSISWAGLGRFNELEVEIGGVTGLSRQPSSVVRSLPTGHTPGVAFSVTNRTSPASWVKVHTVEDEIPAGWSPSTISHSGVWDAQNRKVKWGPFSDATIRDLTYLVVPTTGQGVFRGLARFNEIETLISGVSTSNPIRTRIVRSMPTEFLPGVDFAVTNRTLPGPGIHVHAIEESVPSGWSVRSLNSGGVFDPINRKLKWGPFNDALPRTLVAVLMPGLDSAVDLGFEGQGWDDFGLIEIEGSQAVVRKQSRMVRTLPASGQFGVGFTVRLSVTPTSDVRVHAVEEKIPAGWVASVISDQGALDLANGRVKWGPFSDGQPRILTYVLTPPIPSRATSITGLFSGQGRFDSLDVTTEGDSFIRVTGSAERVVTLLIRQVATDRVEVEVQGEPGVAYGIQTGTDLVNWVPWRTGVADGTGKLVFPDRVRSGGVFYRATDP